MILTLMGMSGSGKGYWSKQLTKRGFKRICCDNLIEAGLIKELDKLGYSGINDVSRWMGQPYDNRFRKNQAKYLKLETVVMNKILKKIKHGIKGSLVIDTTGSVIYTGKEICQSLKKYSRVVNLETSKEVRHLMFNLYIKDPKPVVWQDAFSKRRGENNKTALARCYPKLLESRGKLYSKYAHVTIPYKLRHKKSFTVDDFIKFISK